MRFFILILLSSVQLGFATVRIEGTAATFQNEDLVILAYHNYITNATYTLKKIKLNKQGAFAIDLDIDKQTLLVFKIRDRSNDLYVLPNKKYNLTIQDDVGNEGRLFDKKLQLNLIASKPNELNTLLSEFAERYARFLEENYEAFVTASAKQVILDFKTESLAYFTPKGNGVFMQSLKYLLGNLEDAVVHNKKTIYEELLTDGAVLYHNQEYMTFFVQFYKDRFRQLALGKDGFEILTCVNSTTDVQRLKSILKEDPYLSSDPSLELFILNGLQEVYYDPTFKKLMVKKMLQYIAGNSAYPEHRKIARNMVSEFNFLKPGTQAPVFTLTSKEGNKVVSESLKGKYKYVQFWEPWSVPSIKEQLLIKKLFEKYGETIEFVSISSERWNELAKKDAVPQYPWMFLFGTDQSTIFEDFRVRSVPTYLVLDKDNKIVQYPADSPVSIEKLLYEISMK